MFIHTFSCSFWSTETAQNEWRPLCHLFTDLGCKTWDAGCGSVGRAVRIQSSAKYYKLAQLTRSAYKFILSQLYWKDELETSHLLQSNKAKVIKVTLIAYQCP